MKETIVWLDTEFTHFDSPELISLGMVSAQGDEFYVELADNWTPARCSMFVLGQALPHLAEGATQNFLSDILGDLFELIRWLTAENLQEKREMMKKKQLQGAISRECDLALAWEADPAFCDLTINDVSRVGEIMKGVGAEALTSGSYARTRSQAAGELANWLNRMGRPVVVADNPVDHQLLRTFLNQSGTALNQVQFMLLPHLSPTRVSKWPKVHQAREDYYVLGGRRHHALDDARALARWWREAEKHDLLFNKNQ
jgi:hypothetical protein